jgi:carbon-monoxide dehydrogenase medium subunit
MTMSETSAEVVQVGTDGTSIRCHIAVTGAGPTAVRARGTEDAQLDRSFTAESIATAAAHAADGMTFLSDIYAGESYRAALSRVQ